MVAVLVAIGVNSEGSREILAVMEGAKEDTESWRAFLRHLKERGLRQASPAGGGDVSGWRIGVDVGGGTAALRGGHEMGNAVLFEHALIAERRGGGGRPGSGVR